MFDAHGLGKPAGVNKALLFISSQQIISDSDETEENATSRKEESACSVTQLMVASLEESYLVGKFSTQTSRNYLVIVVNNESDAIQMTGSGTYPQCNLTNERFVPHSSFSTLLKPVAESYVSSDPSPHQSQPHSRLNAQCRCNV